MFRLLTIIMFLEGYAVVIPSKNDFRVDLTYVEKVSRRKIHFDAVKKVIFLSKNI